jgi:DNA-binding NarL/FixJ family response regulator
MAGTRQILAATTDVPARPGCYNKDMLILGIPGSPSQPRLRVLVAEGLPLVRALLRDLLTAQPGVGVAGEVTTTNELLAQTRRLTPDLVLLDWTLGGLGTLQALCALDPAPAVIVLIAGADPEYCTAVLAHGGAACLPREHLYRLLPAALQQVGETCGKGVPHDRS